MTLFIGLQSTAQERDSTLTQISELPTHTISLPHMSYPTADSLLHTIEIISNITISYSTRVLADPKSSITLRHKQWQLIELLDKVFGRYKVQYHIESNKIIVTPPDNTKRYVISGYVRDAVSRESLIGANIYDSLLLRGATTNGYGFFSFTLPEGHVPFKASFIGYKTYFTDLDLHSDTLLNITLTPHTRLLNFEINAPGVEIPNDGGVGMVRLPLQQVKAMPTLFGESDIIRAIQQTPGIQCGEEGFGGMSVRGGGSDQNIVLLDDVPLYNPMHLMGLYTIFNSEGINSATLIKGGFPARYGGRMSSVLDVKMREGDMKHFHGYLNFGLLASNAMFEGPIIEDKMSFIVSARRTYFALISDYIQRKSDSRYSFYFYDVSAKLNYKINDRNRVYISYFMGYDNLDNDYNFRNKTIHYNGDETREIQISDKQQYRWGNIIAAARWNHIYGNQIFSNFTTSFSRYRFKNNHFNYNIYNTQGTTTYYSGVNDLGFKMDASYHPEFGFINVIRVGTELILHYFYPGFSISSNIGNNEPFNNDAINASVRTPQKKIEGHTYVESHLTIRRFNANFGIHFSMIDRKNQSPFLQIEPRILSTYTPNNRVKLRIGGSCMSQFIQQMHFTNVATPADLWLPISDTTPPPRVWQLSMESEISISDDLRLTGEVYTKKYVRLQTFKTTSAIELLSSGDWKNLYITGDGYSYGSEIMLHKKNGPISGWISYTYSHARNRFCGDTSREYPQTGYYPTDYDKPHSVNLYSVFNLNDKIDISALWTLSSGAPITISESSYAIVADPNIYETSSMASLPGEKNKYRLKNSHMLNIGVNIHNTKSNGERTFSFGVYNVYAKRNPMFVYWKQQEDAEGNTTNQLKQYSLIAMPWPYIKYSIRF